MSDLLQDWKAEVIRIWCRYSGQTPNSRALECFSELLELPVPLIREQLNVHGSPAESGFVALLDTPMLQPNAERDQQLSAPVVHTDTEASSLVLKDAPTRINTSTTDRSAFLPHDIGDPSANVGTGSTGATMDSNLLLAKPLNTLPSSLSASVLEFIHDDIRCRQTKGCPMVKQDAARKGTLLCTLGCGASFKSGCDRRRHEETVFPQKYWVCYLCTSGLPTKGQFFIRLDKIQEHSTRYHSNGLNIDRCRVFGIGTLMPGLCGLCGYRYQNEHDRCQHTEKCHSGRPFAAHRASSKRSVHPNEQHVDKDLLRNSAQQRSRALVPASPGSLTTMSVVKLYPLLCGLSTRSLLASTAQEFTVNWLRQINDKGATCTVHKVEIAFDLIAGTPSVPLEYAVKQFSQSKQRYFEQELAAYTAIGRYASQSSTITRCFGSFRGMGPDGRTTYNLLLELAQSDLWDFWRNTTPPTSFVQIKSTYSRLFELASGLETLHEVREQTSSYAVCFHGDIKPENILLSSEATLDSPYAILSHRWVDFSHSGVPADRKWAILPVGEFSERTMARKNFRYMCCATRNYRPPPIDAELRLTNALGDSRDMVFVFQKSDMWSFGCVLSLAATWMVAGIQGVRHYEKLRRSAQRGTTRTASAAFHDGIKVLPEIKRWHDYLRAHIHAEDTITRSLLDVIETCLLQTNPILRVSSRELWKTLERIIQGAQVEISSADDFLGTGEATNNNLRANPNNVLNTIVLSWNAIFADETTTITPDLSDISNVFANGTDISGLQPWESSAMYSDNTSYTMPSTDSWAGSSQSANCSYDLDDVVESSHFYQYF